MHAKKSPVLVKNLLTGGSMKQYNRDSGKKLPAGGRARRKSTSRRSALFGAASIALSAGIATAQHTGPSTSVAPYLLPTHADAQTPSILTVGDLPTPAGYFTDFSIGHRGAALQFPEHTKESYEAAARMGAGIVECDVTFTKDKELVCRHSQCDLHTTTNILATPLAAKCTQNFKKAEFDAAGNLVSPASAQCCTSDITLAEFKTLKRKMDAFNDRATTVEEFMDATPSFRTDLYASKGTLLSHAESIDLFKKLDVKMTPELKFPSVPMPFNGYTQEQYAQ
jgi:glycerophosphoryl diester phosphodiesterase